MYGVNAEALGRVVEEEKLQWQHLLAITLVQHHGLIGSGWLFDRLSFIKRHRRAARLRLPTSTPPMGWG